MAITPKQRRAQMIAERASKKKTKLQEFLSKKRTPLRTSKRAREMANVEKELPRGTPAASQMEDAKKTAVASKVGKAAGKAAAKPSTAKRAMAGLSEFGKAFAAARKAGKKDFTFRDKQYAAITKQEVQKAGASGLGDYLNKLKRKNTEIAKAPGQVTKKKGGMAKYQEGGSVITEETRRRLERAMPKTFERDFDRSKRERLQEMKEAQMSDAEIRRIQREMNGMKSGGSVMARGCKLGRKKPTKMY